MVLSEKNKKELRNLILAHPDWGSRKLQRECSFKVSHTTVDVYMKSTRKDLQDLINYQNGDQARELTETLRANLEKDLNNLRNLSWKKIKEAMGDPKNPKNKPDEEAILTWFREATRTADTTSRHLKAFNILIDNSKTDINIIQQTKEETAREIFKGPLKCPHCGKDVVEDLLRQHVRELEE